ncbi:MAG: mechanosensitive ion channel [Porphyromonas sp.]|nr:mechanosensitive ion channel [Porphyromonas sp.]
MTGLEPMIRVSDALPETMNTMPEIRQWLIQLIDFLNLGLVEDTFLYKLLSLGIVVAFVVVVEILLRLFFLRSIPKMLARIPALKGMEMKSKEKVVGRVIRIITVSMLAGLLPIVFTNPTSVALKLLRMACSIYNTVLIAQVLGMILNMTRNWMLSSEKHRNSPLVNLFQVIKGIVWFIAVLVIFSILFSMDMKTIATSLTALSAVLMLVFKDSILGFVASIQLSSNDMVRVGDWITVPKTGVDGDVIDISLATVKVRNFDKTVSYIPPYSLLTDSFQNWRPMQESGGRRVVRSIYIDMRTIKYADQAFLDKLRAEPILRDYIEDASKEIEVDNETRGLKESITRRRLTNVGVFRKYVVKYLQNNPYVHQDYTLLVRQRQPSELGLPIELYFFTNTTVWSDYESIQSDVFDHLLAVIDYFDLSVFQAVNGNDVQKTLTTVEQVATSVEQAKNKNTDLLPDEE